MQALHKLPEIRTSKKLLLQLRWLIEHTPMYECNSLKYNALCILECFHVVVVDPSQKILHLSCNGSKDVKVISEEKEKGSKNDSKGHAIDLLM